jgi:tetratricopeptide (TPR) repeat protein
MKKKIAVAIWALLFISGIAFAQNAGLESEGSVEGEEAVSDEVSDLTQEMQHERQRPEVDEQAPSPYQMQNYGGAGTMLPENSILFYEQALKENPNNYVALTALAGLYANVRADISKSIKLYEKAIEINDRYDLAHLGLGMDYATLGMNNEARQEFEKTIMLSKRKYVQQAARDAISMLGE